MKCVWVLSILFVQNSVGAFEDKVVKTIRNASNNGRISDQCSNALTLYVENLNSTDDQWALKMLDATSKIPVGLLFSLNYGELGEFNQCLDTQSQDGFIKGKYCLGTISLSSLIGKETDWALLQQQVQKEGAADEITNLGIRAQNTASIGSGPTWAICLPSDCSDNDIADILKNLIGSPGAVCQTKEDISPTLTDGAIATIFLLACVVTLLVVSTIADLYYIHINKESPNEILVAFSVYKNGRKLFKINKNSTEMSCLNGIRLLSMFWVIIGHWYSAHSDLVPVSNFKDLLTWASSDQSSIISSGNLAVDSFLFVGGLLVVYGFMKAKHNGVKFNIFHFYFHRYLRLTPTLAAVVMVTSTLLIYMGSGPKWSNIDASMQQPCQKYWWSALLYLQNYVNPNDMCVSQSWYLSVDMQLYIFSPLILLPLWRHPKLGVTIVASLILASIIIPVYVAYYMELPGVAANFRTRTSSDKKFDYLSGYYYNTLTRASPWVIGALLGYLLAKIKFSTERNLRIINIGKPIYFLLWIICAILTFSIIFGAKSLQKLKDNRWPFAILTALMRPIWAVCVAWVIFACEMGYGGPINFMLSLPIYQVLNRFTYSIYLLHVAVITMVGLSSKKSVYFSTFNANYSFWGVTMFSFGLSVLWVLAFESPMIYIEKIIFKGINNALSKTSVCARRNQSQSSEPIA